VADMLAKRSLRNDTAGLGLISNIEWRVSDDRTFNSITGYRSVDQEFVLDFSLARLNTTPGPFGLNNDGEYDMISQEFKFTGALGYSSWRDIGNTTTTYALYAQVDWQLADRFTAILGARYTAETKEVDLRPTQYGGMTTADLREAGIDTDLDTSIVTPRLGLNFQASDDVMIYASATRGFKAGGWNSRTAYRPQEFQPMDPEKTWSYEAGFKSELLENRLRVNATVFYAETDDLQLSYTTPGPIAGTTLSTQNIECKNCSDEEYLSSIFNGEFYGQPRRVNGSVTFSFWS